MIAVVTLGLAVITGKVGVPVLVVPVLFVVVAVDPAGVPALPPPPPHPDNPIATKATRLIK